MIVLHALKSLIIHPVLQNLGILKSPITHHRGPIPFQNSCLTLLEVGPMDNHHKRPLLSSTSTETKKAPTKVETTLTLRVSETTAIPSPPTRSN
ncbi:hypothetical protein Syun_000915 [Stephania yunnanensis]|uniref:Uncharacterized protein n=1 Tax=Stephania yunnanensis TaxID=152371 RepID=A0AAP0Q5Z9_9MAGN